MVALRLQNFGGMIPVVDDRLLPDNQAALSENTWLVTGSVQGFRAPTPVHTLANPRATKAYRIPKESYDKDHIQDSYWLEFTNPDTDVISSPSVGDSYERFYWCSPAERPKYNTKARIIAGSAAYFLGIPAPTVAPTVGVTGGTTPTETRAYVYTWVSAYGEEGPPSPPTLATGNASGTWTITTTAPGTAATGRNLARVRIYRTITGSTGSTTYYYVGDMVIGSTSYVDTAATALVAANNVLESVFFEPPPLDLKGMLALPNGIVAGFRANEVWFAEPYLPHAWPSLYTLAVEGEVVGLGVVGQSLIVCTTGSPYVIYGVNPSAMSISRMSFSEPCLSRGSIVSSPFGVVYASPNGLVVANPGNVQVATTGIFSKEDWLDSNLVTAIPQLRGSLVNGAYYGWGSAATGCFESTAFDNDVFAQLDYTGAYSGAYIDIKNSRVSFVKLTSVAATENCFMDSWTGETFFIRDGTVFWLDLAPSRDKETFIWRSKLFQTPNRRNFEAMRVFFDEDDAIGGPFTGGAWDDTLAWDDGSAWYDTATGVYGYVRVYADKRLILTRALLASGDFIRLPSGFKASFWQVEVEGATQINSVEMATSAKELGDV